MMTLSQLKDLFVRTGVKRLFAKELAENDNSKNQIYFAGAIETLNVFPCRQILADPRSNRGPTFKAKLDFGWLQESGSIVKAPGAQLIFYAQYPEVRFSGFLKGCGSAPGKLMLDRARTKAASRSEQIAMQGRVLFLGITSDRKTIGFVAAGNSTVAQEFKSTAFADAFVVFKSIPLPDAVDPVLARSVLLQELRRVHEKGWITSKQLSRSGELLPCNAPQCGGFTLEAELGIPKNSDSEPDFMGWEIKQHNVSSFERLGSGTITLMTPEPTGGIYRDGGVEKFVHMFGYPDLKGREDRLNFGGIHRVGLRHERTGLTLAVRGFDAENRALTDANGQLALISDNGDIAASWDFSGLLEHWSRKHACAAYVPSQCSKAETVRQYRYGNAVRLGTGTDSLKLLESIAAGAVYYDPGIKLEHASTSPKAKKRSQFRVASKNLSALYSTFETVET